MPAVKIIIQSVNTIWTKASRGGVGARRRNELPHTLSVPLESFASLCALHRVDFSEFNDFGRVESVRKGCTLTDLKIRDLVLNMNSDRLEVQLRRDPNNAAIANRNYSDLDVLVFTLKTDEWGQLRYNGRYVDVDRSNWWYEQNIYNIGLFSGVAVNRFIETQPTKRHVEMATLF